MGRFKTLCYFIEIAKIYVCLHCFMTPTIRMLVTCGFTQCVSTTSIGTNIQGTHWVS